MRISYLHWIQKSPKAIPHRLDKFLFFIGLEGTITDLEGTITDLEVEPDGVLYVLSGFREDQGTIYRIIPK